METLRVLHIIQFLRGYGAERQICDLIPYLQDEGITAGIVSMYASHLSAEERDALPFQTIDVGRKSRADYRFLPRLVAEIRRFSPHIVHTHTHSGKYWGRIAAWLAGVKTVVYTEHNPCDPRRSRVEKILDPLLHARTTRIITFLQAQKPVLSRADRVTVEKIAVIANGLPQPAERSPEDRIRARALLGVGPGEAAVLLVGRLEFQKNEELALRAIAAMPEAERRSTRLFFVGSGSDEIMLRELARALEIQEQVRFLGYRSDVADLLPGADLLLMTSLFEGMPLTLIEAMNAGVPILTTPWIGASEMLGNGVYGFISPGWSSHDVSTAMLRALKNGGARSAIVERAKRYARETFDIRQMARAHRNLYQDLCRETA